MQTVYMVAIMRDNGKLDWYCTGKDHNPFISFHKYKAQAEVTKLNKIGYRASIVTVNPRDSTCFIDLKMI